MTPTVSGTVTDATGNTAAWSASWTVSGSSTLPGQIPGKVLVGMSTDDYQSRVTELGRPIGADHFFVDSWDPAEFIQKATLARQRGLFPYGNIKVGQWSTFGGSAGDAMVEDLGARLAAFGDPVRVTFHHEPGLSGPTGTGEAGTAAQWVSMGLRQYPRLKSIAPNAIGGPVINGFIMSPNTNGQGWTFTELNQLFSDAYLDMCANGNAFGGDYYDGATTRTNGEPAWKKVERCSQWLDSRGYTGRADIGEFNFVKPADCDAMTTFLTANANRWWCALNFNSDNNNRANIPTIGGGWNLSHGFDTQWDRRDAFRRMLDHALIHP